MASSSLHTDLMISLAAVFGMCWLGARAGGEAGSLRLP